MYERESNMKRTCGIVIEGGFDVDSKDAVYHNAGAETNSDTLAYLSSSSSPIPIRNSNPYPCSL
jgi:hypothetical protein